MNRASASSSSSCPPGSSFSGPAPVAAPILSLGIRLSAADPPAEDGSSTKPCVPLFPWQTSVLPDVEIVALLLGAGCSTAAELDLARALLENLGGLAVADLPELGATEGLGAAHTALLLAAMELGRRTAGRRPERGHRLAAAHEVFTHYRARLASASAEEFWVLGLDVRHRLIFETCVARGSLTGVEVHPREVYRPLIRAAAAATIFCHNHPSGDPTPSRQDLELTARLKEVGALCGIAVLDHVVVAADGFVSLAERGWL